MESTTNQGYGRDLIRETLEKGTEKAKGCRRFGRQTKLLERRPDPDLKDRILINHI